MAERRRFQTFPALLWNGEVRPFPDTTPIITSNWLAPAGQQWVVPVGAGAGRVSKLFDKLPIKLYLGAYYNAVQPSQTSPSWQLRSQLTLIF